MSLPISRLPPLNALRAFWVVVKHGSIRSAADELSVTPQAISQQIKLLEDVLQIQLFERKGRVIEPTERAILLSNYVQAAFEQLIEGVRRVSNATYRNRININVSPYFATRYLMEHLERFHQIFPDVDVRLTTMVKIRDFAADEIDVAILWGFGDWRNYDVSLLMLDPKVICCSPSRAKDIRIAADLAQQTLLHPMLASDLWDRILRYLDVAAPDATGHLELQDAATMRRGAMSGIGVGLISRLDALADIEAGRMVAPLGTDILADMSARDVPGFYLVVPRAHKRVKVIAEFCRWIVSEDWNADAQLP